jgi:osmotically-inducible protein OsmY
MDKRFTIQQALSTLCLVFPLFLVGTGCSPKSDTASSTPPASNAVASVPSTNADNSGNNARDKNSGTVTPGDQGSSSADTKITQQIRQQVVSGTNHFSVAARNIKIITMNGKVTLRGPVDSETEKSGIEGIAKTTAGEGNVDDQLEVKTNSNQ